MNAKRNYGLAPFHSPESWGSKSKISHLKSGEGLVGIKVETRDDKFVIPVADTRINQGKVKAIEKAENIQRGSKYFRPSYSVMGHSYNHSTK